MKTQTKARIGISFLMAILLLLVLPKKVLADYDLTKMNVKAVVNSDGSLSMTRQIDYDFDDEANGVYYTQNLNSDQKVTSQSVQIKDLATGKTVTPKLNNSADSGNVYHFTKSSNSYKFKVYHHVDEGKIRVIYRYKITKAITTYDDASELNFKIIGDGWDQEISKVTASVVFQKPNLSFLKGWVHTNTSGNLEVNKEKGQVTATVAKLPENTFLEMHILFPNSLTAKNTKKKSGEIMAKTVEQEKQLAKETAAKQKQKKRLEKIGLVVLSLLPLLGLPIFFKAKNQGAVVRSKKEIGHNYEIPPYSPAVAQSLVTGDDPDAKALAGELALKAGHKEITIEPLNKGKDFRYTKTDKYQGNVKLINQLFKGAGDGTTFTSKGLKNYGKKGKLEKKVKAWQEVCEDQIKKQFVDPNLRKKKDSLEVAAVLLFGAEIILTILGFFAYDYYTMSLLLVLLWEVLAAVPVIIRIKNFSVLTEKGKEAIEQAMGFKNMLDDIGQFKLRDVGELTLWEEIMPYAVAFGLAKKVLKQMKVEFASEIDASPIAYYYYGNSYGMFATSFESSFSRALADSSGGSGSFSATSVSSGGFGGGSGGGAF